MKPEKTTTLVTAIIYDSYTASDGDQTTRVAIPTELWRCQEPHSAGDEIETGYYLVGYHVGRRWAVVVVDCKWVNCPFRAATVYDLHNREHREASDRFVERHASSRHRF